MEQRPFMDSDVRAMQEMASRLWPVGRHPGGLGWEWGRQETDDEIQLFFVANGLAGWAAVSHPGTLWSQAEPGNAEVADAIVDVWLHHATGDAGLDMVAVAPDGSLAGCCIGWLDPSTGVAEIEPLGVHPAHRRRGLAGSLCLAVVAGVASRGGREAFINVVPGTIYPGAEAYAKVGFRTRHRGHKYLLNR